jgi:hypothetical protein
VIFSHHRSTMSLTPSSAERAVRERGFAHVFYWRDPPYVSRHCVNKKGPFQPITPTPSTKLTQESNTYYPPHTHPVANTHLIVEGSLRIRFPPEREEREFAEGEWVDVEKGCEHEVWVGREGCGMVIGEMV